jgi:PleD family two-component response regulator
MMIDEEKISVTASLGVTLAKPEDTLESIIERADKLMYISKRKGGNNFTLG